MPDESLNVRSIFDRALEITSDAERAAYLNEVCAAAPEIRQQVEALLRAHSQAGSFLESPPPGVTAAIDSSELSEHPGSAIGAYKLLEQIGEGGMGTVWMAQQTEPVKRVVALKLIKAGMDSRQIIARFEAECQALALMDHPNIAKVLDGGAASAGRPYFVMDLVKGVPITRYCDEHRLTPRERLDLFLPVCQAVQHAHQKGIIHRDLKPSNVLVALCDGKPVPKVIDFGVAKATGQLLTAQTLITGFGNIVGTLEYMSPEQADANHTDIDTRSDIYSLGVLLYELLTGSPPFPRQELEKAGMLEMLRMIREQEPIKPSTRLSTAEGLSTLAVNRGTEPARLTKLLRGELDWIIMKALEKDRNRRYETANGLAMDIQRYLADEPVVAGPPSAAYRFRKFARRNRAALTMVAVVAAALVLGIVGTTWQAIRAIHQRDRAVLAEDLAQTRLESESRARQEAEGAHKEADLQRRLAEENLRKARSAVDDWFTKISQTTLLDAPGLLPLRKELLEAAVSYYKAFAEQGQNEPELQADLAAAHLRLATILSSLDRNDDAVVEFLRGLERVEQLIQQPPGDTEFPKRLAGFLKASGTFQQHTQFPADPAKVIRTLNRAVEIWEQFARDHPDVVEFQGDLAGQYSLLAALHEATDPDQAVGYSLKARTVLEEIVRARPGIVAYQDLLLLVYDTTAYHLKRAGRSLESDRLPSEAVRYFTTLARQFPKEFTVRRSLATVQHRLAESLRETKPRAAEQTYRQTLDLLERLVVESPTDARCRQALILTYENLADVLRQVGSNDDADEIGRKAAVVRGKLIMDFPHVREYQLDSNADHLSRIAVYLHNIPIPQEKPDDAVKRFERCIALQQAALKVKPEASSYRVHLGNHYLALGDALTGNGDHTNAKEAYDEAIAIKEKLGSPPHERAHAFRQRGAAYIRMGYKDNAGADFGEAARFRRAIADFDKAIELDPSDHFNWYHAAVLQLQLGDFEGYRRTCREMLSRFGQTEDPNIAERTAKTCLLVPQAVSDTNFVMKLADRAVNGTEEREDYWWFALARGMADYREGRFEAAIGWLRKAGAAQPSSEICWSEGTAYVFLAMAQQRLGQAAEARQSFDTAHKLTEPKSPDAGRLLGPDWDDCLRFRIVLREAEELLGLYGILGADLAKQGKLDEAIAAFRKAIELDPNSKAAASVYFHLGKALEHQGKLDETIACFQKAIELDAKFAVAHSALAWLLTNCRDVKLRDPQRALEVARKTVELAPQSPFAWQMLGWAHYRAGDWKDSIETLEKSCALQDNPKGGDSFQWFFLAMAHWQLGDMDQACEWYERAVEWMEKHASNDGNLRRFRAEAEEPLHQWIEHAVEENPSDPERWLRRAYLGARRGDWDGARQDFLAAVDLRPDDLGLLGRIANFCLWYGRGREAAAVYDRAIEKSPSNAALKVRRAQLQPGVVTVWNFDAGPEDWDSPHECTVSASDGVLHIETTGDDPWVVVPVTAPPGWKDLTLHVRTGQECQAQLFWATDQTDFAEERSVHFVVQSGKGEWTRVTVRFRVDSALTSLRIDPVPGGKVRWEIDAATLANVEPPPK